MHSVDVRLEGVLLGEAGAAVLADLVLDLGVHALLVPLQLRLRREPSPAQLADVILESVSAVSIPIPRRIAILIRFFDDIRSY